MMANQQAIELEDAGRRVEKSKRDDDFKSFQKNLEFTNSDIYRGVRYNNIYQ